MKSSLRPLLILGALVAACGIPATGPIALDDTASVEAGGQTTIQVLINDRAPPGETLRITDVDGAIGEVEIMNDALVYSAPDNFAGEDRFRYFVMSDTSGGETSANVVVSVGSPPSTTMVGGELVVTTGPRLELGTVFATQVVEVRIVLEAVDGDYFIEGFDQGEVSLFPESECSPLRAGSQCEATVLWSPTAPGVLEETITIAGTAQLDLAGEAISPLVLSPDHQELTLSLDQTSGEFRAEASNISDAPVQITNMSGFGAFEGADTSSRQCDLAGPQAVLDGGTSCVIMVTTEFPDITPGAVFEGGLRVAYGTSSVEATAVVRFGGLQPPSWVRPVPGQGIWWELLRQGFDVDWEEVPYATAYGLEARVCTNDESECMAIGEPQLVDESSGFVSFPIDPALLDAPYLAAQAFPRSRVIVLTTYAIGTDAEGNEITSEPSESRHDLRDGPFDVFDITYNPPSGSTLLCNTTRLNLSVSIQSNLLDLAELKAQIWDGDFETPYLDPMTETVAPSAESAMAEISYVPTPNYDALFDRIELFLGSHFGASDPVQFPVSGCLR